MNKTHWLTTTRLSTSAFDRTPSPHSSSCFEILKSRWLTPQLEAKSMQSFRNNCNFTKKVPQQQRQKHVQMQCRVTIEWFEQYYSMNRIMREMKKSIRALRNRPKDGPILSSNLIRTIKHKKAQCQLEKDNKNMPQTLLPRASKTKTKFQSPSNPRTQNKRHQMASSNRPKIVERKSPTHYAEYGMGKLHKNSHSKTGSQKSTKNGNKQEKFDDYCLSKQVSPQAVSIKTSRVILPGDNRLLKTRSDRQLQNRHRFGRSPHY